MAKLSYIKKNKIAPNKQWKQKDYLKAKIEVEENVLISVLEKHLEREVVMDDAELCSKVFYLQNRDNYQFLYKGRKLGDVSITPFSPWIITVEFFPEKS